MTQAPDEREMLVADLMAAHGCCATFEATADFILASGWCRREAVLREALDEVRSITPEANTRVISRMCEAGTLHELKMACYHVQAQAEAAITALLTPQARKEGE